VSPCAAPPTPAPRAPRLPAPKSRAPALLFLAGCLALLLLGRSVMPTLPGAAAWGELFLPRLGAQDALPSFAFAGTPAPAPGGNLTAAVSAARFAPGAGPAAPYLGLVSVLLVGYALLAGRFGLGPAGRHGAARRAPRITRALAGLALVVLALSVSLPAVFAGLAWALAAWGLIETGRARAPDEDALPALLLGAASVILTATLAGLALSAGAAPDRELLAPLLWTLDPPDRAAWTPSMLAVNGAHVRAVLDRSALAAFAGMVALLLHLKARRPLTGCVLAAVLVADLASVAPPAGP
jgi:hypothetical protein